MPAPFRLKALLSVRQARRDAFREELAAAEARHRGLADRCRRIDDQLAAHREWLRQRAQPGTIVVEALQSACRYEQGLRAELAEAARDVRAAAERAEDCRQALAVAHREVRALEILAQRRRDAWVRTRVGAEARQLVESTVREFARQTASGASNH